MPLATFTLIGEQTGDITVEASAERVLVTPSDLSRLTGWDLKPEGLCRGDVCIPRSLNADLDLDGRLDLSGFAVATGAPVVVDLDEHVVAVGVAVAERANALMGRTAQPFTLPDLTGHALSLDDFAGKKKLLLTWASW